MDHIKTKADEVQENETDSADQTTSKTLSILFLRIWAVLLVLNILGGGVLLLLQSRVDQSLMNRDANQRRSIDSMGTSTWPVSWPAPKHWALFKGPLPFVNSVYAVSWDDQGTKYFLDAIVVQLPGSVCYKRKTRVLKRGEVSVPARSTDWITRFNIDPVGLMINSLLYTTVTWVLVGGLPAAARASRERELQRQRERELMCLHCHYDIQDLSVCPECGNPSHRV